MRRLGSNLFKLGEEYAAYKNFRMDKFAYEKSILVYFCSSNADKFFLRQYERTVYSLKVMNIGIIIIFTDRAAWMNYTEHS
ncbi:MAG: hypothetical protein IPM96_18870 [Ignavibacteria bacterium]|nr:hypothetical protein [Ignavibacteria bacterium]